MKFFISFLFIITFSGLIFIYVKITSQNIVEINNSKIKTKKIKQETLKKPVVYNLPARILFIKIDLKSIRYILMYRLILNIKDKFELFNVKAILENLNISYSMYESRKNIKIYILFKNLNEAESVLNLFKEYNFNIKIQKIKQRI